MWLEAIRTRDPVLLGALLAATDDEADAQDEPAAVVEARQDYAAGRARSSAQVRR